ncbi:MAG: hypothetical protein CMJ75_16230 [Planctomycetaceae bacterium]|nr:hypothetical protein [Planctomycetaceae bacterium]
MEVTSLYELRSQRRGLLDPQSKPRLGAAVVAARFLPVDSGAAVLAVRLMCNSWRRWTMCLLVVAALPTLTGAAEKPPGSLRFTVDVLPILRKHCVKCHGGTQRKAELNLQTLGGLARGGESGQPTIVVGASQRSYLIQQVSSGEMPPGPARLDDRDVGVLRDWIDNAARQEVATVDDHLSADLQRARRVQFLLEVKCQPCHGREAQEGGLDVRTMSTLLAGGKSGPAVVRGDVEKSLLLRRIRDDQMPPREVRYKRSIKPITSAELELLQAWIAGGAVDPPPPPGLLDDEGLLVDAEDRSWWSFQKPQRPRLPAVTERPPPTPVDRFLTRRLQDAGLEFSPPANRKDLIRRASIILHGLLPEPAQVVQFESDRSPDGLERLVDRLLASPRYGERSAQHWLDAVGYADSEGSVDFVYPLVYQYRDYVIRSMNRDKPYDRFLLEQLAGDELVDYGKLPRLTEEHRDNLIATGFLRNCIDPTTSPETNFLYDRYQVLADTVEIMGSAVLGLTLHCSRCHSHKYDPLPQRDYYRFTALFAAAYSPYDWIKPKDRFLELVGVEERQAIADHNAQIDQRIAAEKLRLQQQAATWRKQFQQAELAKLPEPLRQQLRQILATSVAERTAAQRKLFAQYQEQLAPDNARLAETFSEFKQAVDTSGKSVKELTAQRRTVPRAHGLTDRRRQADPFYLLRRGEWNRRGRRVRPGVPAVLQEPGEPFRLRRSFDEGTTTGFRYSLARWLTKADHPLTTRVLVNRIWRDHFGRGIVATVDNLGKTGSLPTHPQLLDWLAVEFVHRGWSTKWLHRQLMTSRAWRQQSRNRPAAVTIDPTNRLLWRVPLRRLDAETLRDSLLRVVGDLNLQMLGPAVGVKTMSDGQVVTPESSAGRRRSLYLLHRRSTPLTILETFDAPRITVNCIQRRTSNVVSQALLMFNSRFVDAAATRLATRILQQTREPSQQVSQIYQRILGRSPQPTELAEAVKFLAQQGARYAADVQSEIPPRITSVLGLHASKGITFDLAAVRRAHPGARVARFDGVAALGYYQSGAGDANWYVFVDGEQRAGGRLLSNQFARIEMELPAAARFLTLVTSSNGTMNTDWTFFGNPRVLLEQDGAAQALDLADIVGGGDGSGNGSAVGLDPWSGRVLEDQGTATRGRINQVYPVSQRPLIDAVFVPHGSGDGKREIPVSTSGLVVKGISAGSGTTHAHIWNGHNQGISGLKQVGVTGRNGALVDLCLVLLNAAEFLYVD